MLNHVIVERFNWSGARYALRWREDEITREEKGIQRGTKGTEGMTGEVREERTAFVRVATWIRRRDREVPRKSVARAGAVSAPPATPSRMETYSRGSLGTTTRRTLLEHAHARTAHAYRRVLAPIGANSRSRGATSGNGKIEREMERREKKEKENKSRKKRRERDT